MQRIEVAKAGGQESWQKFVDAIFHMKSQVNKRGTIQNFMHLLHADIPQVLIPQVMECLEGNKEMFFWTATLQETSWTQRASRSKKTTKRA